MGITPSIVLEEQPWRGKPGAAHDKQHQRRVLADMDSLFADPSNNKGSAWGMATAALKMGKGDSKFTGASMSTFIRTCPHSRIPTCRRV